MTDPLAIEQFKTIERMRAPKTDQEAYDLLPPLTRAVIREAATSFPVMKIWQAHCAGLRNYRTDEEMAEWLKRMDASYRRARGP